MKITQEDIDCANEFWRLSVNWGSMEDMRKLIAAHRIAQMERDAVIAESVDIYPNNRQLTPEMVQRKIAKAIRDQDNDR